MNPSTDLTLNIISSVRKKSTGRKYKSIVKQKEANDTDEFKGNFSV